VENIDLYQVPKDLPVRNAIKVLDGGGIGFIVIVDIDNTVIGVVTDGDLRRAILSGVDLSCGVLEVANRNFVYIDIGYEEAEVENILRNTLIKHIPVLAKGRLVNIITEESFFKLKVGKTVVEKQINCPVVIMAGGNGTRLDPFTRILPKPLIPIGNKAMIEVIMDEYSKFGVSKFYVSVFHKEKMMRAYFDNDFPYEIEFLTEDEPLGTAGALKYLDHKIESPFFVSNCDIIIKDDYRHILEFHLHGNYALTLVGSMQHHSIPYGVCEIENGGELKRITEKPHYDFLVNTGMYLLNPDVLSFIPQNEFFHITDLISVLLHKGISVGVYPVSEKSYIDVGEWGEYKKALKLLSW